MENFAERLFCDLRNAEIKIDKAIYIESGTRVGEHNTKQFNITKINGKCSFSEGPSSDLTCTLTFTQAYQLLLAKLSKRTIRFYSLATPQKGPEVARLEEFERVVTRYLKDYLHMLDENMERWDVCIEDLSL